VTDAVVVVGNGDENNDDNSDRDSTEVSEALAERAQEEADESAQRAESEASMASSAAAHASDASVDADEAAAEASAAAQSALSTEDRIVGAIEQLPDKIAAGIALAMRAVNAAADTNDDGVTTQEEITAADEAPGNGHWWFRTWGRRDG
jgi:hypothetical protein